MAHLAIYDMAGYLCNFEPIEVPERRRSRFNPVLHGVLDTFLGCSNDFSNAINMSTHMPSPMKILTGLNLAAAPTRGAPNLTAAIPTMKYDLAAISPIKSGSETT